jgi:hypothetical protein
VFSDDGIGGTFNEPPQNDPTPDMEVIMEEFGFENIEDVVIDFEKLDDPEVSAELAFSPGDVRGRAFVRLSDAIVWLYEIGVLGFSRVTSFTNEDGVTFFFPLVPDTTP